MLCSGRLPRLAEGLGMQYPEPDAGMELPRQSFLGRYYDLGRTSRASHSRRSYKHSNLNIET